MNTMIERPSATIIPFPSRRRFEQAERIAAEIVPVPEVAVIDGWYHADAIRESEPVSRS